MKKRVALALTLLFLAGCAAEVYEGPTESAWVRIDSITTLYNAYSDETQTHRRTDSYDSFGNQVRTIYYSDDELTGDHQRTYDDRGNCIREVTWDRVWNFTYPAARTDYTYDEQNRPLTVTYRNGFGFKTGGDTYTYDDEANTVTWEGTYDTQTKYLNENGDPIRIVTISHAAGMEIESRYEYDALGQLIKTAEYLDGTLSSTSEKRYDELGRILEDTWYDADRNILIRTTYQYTENTITTWDKDGNRSVKTLRPDGQVQMQEDYDPAGKLLSRTVNIYTEIRVPAKEE